VPQYVKTSPAALLALRPPQTRYRVTLERDNAFVPFFGDDWDAVVSATADAVNRLGTGIVVLGYPRPANSDRTAVFDVRVNVAEGSGLSVGDIVRAADQGSPWSRVVRIEDVGPVVGFSEPERQAADAAARAAGAVAAEQAAADRTFLARVAGFAGQSSRLVTVVAIAAAVVALAYIVSNARGAAAALSGK
jgi:hypothetical protein